MSISTRVLLLLSMLYGITLAILGYLGSKQIGLIAFVGALLLGFLWAARGILAKKPSTKD
jgi:hypothetical protein